MANCALRWLSTCQMGASLNKGTASMPAQDLGSIGPRMAFILEFCRPFSKSFLDNRQQLTLTAWQGGSIRWSNPGYPSICWCCVLDLHCLKQGQNCCWLHVTAYASPAWECLKWCRCMFHSMLWPEIWYRDNVPAQRLSPRSLYEALHQRKLGPQVGRV